MGLLSTTGMCRHAKPMVGRAVRLQALGGKAQMCAPRDDEFAQRLADVGVPLVPVGVWR